MNRIEYYRDYLNNKGLTDMEKYIIFNSAKQQDMSTYTFTRFVDRYIKIKYSNK